MDDRLKKLAFVCLCLFGITVRRSEGCTPTLQRCQNCFPYHPGCSSFDKWKSEVECAQKLSDTTVIVSVYTESFSHACTTVTCNATFKRSTMNSTTLRIGGCGNGCSNITLIPYDYATITSSASKQTVPVSSHEECITLAVEMAFNGTYCNVVYSSSTGTCEVYTGCPKGGCPRTSSPSHQVEVVTCDSSVLCKQLNTPVHGAVTTSNGYSIGSVATYSCDPGYDLAGYIHKECFTPGVWSTSLVPTCEPAVLCKHLKTPDHGAVTTSNGYSIGSVATYSCDPGYDLAGYIHKECSTPGVWSTSVVPTCEPAVLCKHLKTPDHGAVTTSNGYSIGSVATYSCDPGYDLAGYIHKECSTPGVWSTSVVPTCEPAGTESTIPEPAPRNLYIRSCLCNINSTFQGMTEDEIIQQLVKDTKIDEKTTALSQQKLKCTEDPRRSSKIIGSVGVAIISAIFGLIVLIDCMSLYQWMFHSDNNQT